MSFAAGKPIFRNLGPLKLQISMCLLAVWSGSALLTQQFQKLTWNFWWTVDTDNMCVNRIYLHDYVTNTLRLESAQQCWYVHTHVLTVLRASFTISSSRFFCILTVKILDINLLIWSSAIFRWAKTGIYQMIIYDVSQFLLQTKILGVPTIYVCEPN